MKILAVFGRHAYGDPARGESYEHANILPDLTAIAAPDEVRLFDCWDRSAYGDLAALNRALIAEATRFEPDVVFLILMTHEVWTETLDLLRTRTPAAIVHWGTDDSWKYRQFSRFMARHADLHISTDRPACEQAARDGLTNVVLSQWAACGARLLPPVPSADCRYDVSFVGARYGNRPAWIAGLAGRGIKVACFGKGWDGGVVDAAGIGAIYQRSRVSLNFSDSGLQMMGGRISRSRQIKARTFEVPGCGGVLLSEPADGLERYFDTVREIATFDSPDDLAAKIRFLLANPAERDEMAARAHARVVAEHTYQARLPRLFAEAATRVQASRPGELWRLDPSGLDAAVRRHACGPALRATGAALTASSRAVFGPAKGPRAARRMVHELSWRIAGAHTYSAGGWPGRLFPS